MKVPHVSAELVKWLEGVFPHDIPDPDKDSDSKVWYRAGQAAVVRRVRRAHEEQLTEGSK